jgi:hypothetical protein
MGRRLYLPRGPFPIRQLMLRPTTETFLGVNLRPAVGLLDARRGLIRSRATLQLEVLALRDPVVHCSLLKRIDELRARSPRLTQD